MHLEHRPPDTNHVVGQLLGLPPVPRIIAGSVCLAIGVVVTIQLWGRGVVFGLTIFIGVTGLFLLLSGIAGLRSQAKRKALVASIRSRKEELLRAMLEAKKLGRNPIRLLNEKGIHDVDLRGELVDEMNQRLKSGA